LDPYFLKVTRIFCFGYGVPLKVFLYHLLYVST